MTKTSFISKSTYKKHLIYAVILSALLLGTLLFFAGYTVANPSGVTYSTIIESGSMNTEASYIFFVDESIYYVRNGTTGEIDYSGTNCSYLIQTVISIADSGSRLHFKLGIYYIDATIVIDKNLWFSGECWGAPAGDTYATTLKLSRNVTMFEWTSDTHIFLGKFSDLTLDGNNMTLTESVDYWGNDIGVGNLIRMRGNISDVHFNNVVFMHCGTDALSIMAITGNIWNIWITNCFIEESWSAGIWFHTDSIYNVERVHIEGCHFYDNKFDIAITSDGVNDVIISDNTSELTLYNFLYISQGRDVSAIGNHVYDAGYANTEYHTFAFEINGTHYSKFSHNTIKNFEQNTCTIGMLFTNCNYTLIADNIIYNVASDGIKLHTNTDWCKLDGNIVYDCGGYGIFIADSTCDYNMVTSCQAGYNAALQIYNLGTNSEIHSCWNGTSWIT